MSEGLENFKLLKHDVDCSAFIKINNYFTV